MSRDSVGVVGTLIAVVIVILLIIGGWKLKRWAHWEWDYSGQVKNELAPMKKELKELKERIQKLEEEKCQSNTLPSPSQP